MQHYQRIRDLREDHDLTQDELCKILSMHKTTYTNYEQGKHTVPFDFAVKIADYYNVSLDYIANRTNSFKSCIGKYSKDEMNLLFVYSNLTERNKGKLEQFAYSLLENQRKENL